MAVRPSAAKCDRWVLFLFPKIPGANGEFAYSVGSIHGVIGDFLSCIFCGSRRARSLTNYLGSTSATWSLAAARGSGRSLRSYSIDQ